MTSTEDLADRFGTPLYVYDLDQVDLALAALRSALPAPSVVYYSLKANPHPALARTLRHGGARAEVSSPGELAAAMAAGFTGTECLYTGPGKTRAEIALALQHGVRRFSAESIIDLDRIASLAAERGVVADCLLRVNTAETVGNSGLRMGGAATQFGIDESSLLAGADQLGSREGARLIGVHLFPGSNARDESSLIEALQASALTTARIRRETGLPVTVVNLGGGFAAPYGVPGELPLYPRLRASLQATLDEHLPGWRTGEVEIAFESGRYLVSPAGRLVTTVLDVKVSRGRTFVVADSGINHLGGLSGLGRTLPPEMTPVGAGDGPPGALVGPLCTPVDVLARGVGLGHLAPGARVEIPNVGAYGLTASLLGFLSRPAPIEVTLRGGRVVTADTIQLTRTAIAVPEQATGG